MPYAFRSQPLKGLYLVYQLITTLVARYPLWILFNLIPSWRPRASWSLKKALMVKLLTHLNTVSTQTGAISKLPNHTAIAAGKGANGVWIGGAAHLVTRELKTLAAAAKVSPTRIPGYWIHKNGTSIKVAAAPQPGEKVVLNLHGGAYIRLSAHPSSPTNYIPVGILKHVASVKRVFSVEYRLSSHKPFKVANPFPAALLDALAGYNYLVNVVGFAPSDVIVVGDSAGGNLAHALTRYLVEHQGVEIEGQNATKLPAPPGGLVLLSPWSDLSSVQQASATTNAASDYIDVRELKKPAGSDGGLNYAKTSFLGPHHKSILDTNRYISPASLHPDFSGISFEGFPRTFIVGGGAEVLIDQIRTLKARMVADLGEGEGVKEGEGKIKYYEAPDAIHDYLVFSWCEPERTETLKEIAKWVQAASSN